uniref:Uncharacterized protein n=1 Tax=Rhizophora mucronata TaxID=61149 RepID=A0A2P2IYV0_RHIMU
MNNDELDQITIRDIWVSIACFGTSKLKPTPRENMRGLEFESLTFPGQPS